MKHEFRRTALVCGTLGILLTRPAIAQDQPVVASPAENTGLQQVIVTAQRRGRAEDAQSVPISITALSGETLEQLQIKNVEDLSQYTPSLHVFSETVDSAFYTIRGIGRTSDDLSADPGVAVFLNDIYMSRQAASNVGYFDVDRVEVLKGPQGTLYGKNATAGAINVITREPTRKFSGYLQANLGTYSREDLKGAVSGSLVDNLLYGRLAFSTEHRDGLYTNLTTGQRANDVDNNGIRGTLKATPSKDLTVSLIADWGKNEQHGLLKSVISDTPGTPYEFFVHDGAGAPRPGTTPLPVQEANLLSSRSAINGGQGVASDGVVLNARYTASAFDVMSITGVRSQNNHMLEDLGRTQNITAYTQAKEKTSSASQEFRLVSNTPNELGTENRFSWTSGLYFFHEQGERVHDIYWNVAPFSSITNFDQHIVTNSFGAFGEANYRLLDRLMFTGGVRVTTETKDYHVIASSIPIPGIAGAAADSPLIDADYDTQAARRWKKVSPKAVLTYQIADRMLTYGSVAKGFKSGGFQGEGANAPLQSFNPEDVTNYEIGFKGEFLDRRLRFNIAAFDSDYRNLQLQTFDLNGSPTTSSADARSRGFEAEIKARVSDGLTLSASGSFVDARYRQFIDVQPGFDDAAHAFDMSGKPIALVPRYDVNANAEYELPIGSYGALTFQAAVVAVGRTTEFNSVWSQKYAKGDLRLTWEPVGDHWRLTAWLNNVTDKKYYRGGGPVSKYDTGNVRLGLISDPRTFGLTTTYEFF